MEPYFDRGAEPLEIASIVVPPGPALDEDLVETLRADIAENPAGLIEPIIVRWDLDADQPVLVSGRHRLEAARRAGWKSIDASQFVTDSDDEAKLVGLASNTARRHIGGNELVHQTADFVALRTRVALDAEPRAAAAANEARQREEAQRALRQEAANQIREVAERLSVDKRTVQLRAQWGRDITDASWAILDKRKKLQKVRVYKALAALPQNEAAQVALLQEAIANGDKLIDRNAEMKALMAAWRKASPEVRERFVAEATMGS